MSNSETQPDYFEDDIKRRGQFAAAKIEAEAAPEPKARKKLAVLGDDCDSFTLMVLLTRRLPRLREATELGAHPRVDLTHLTHGHIQDALTEVDRVERALQRIDQRINEQGKP